MQGIARQIFNYGVLAFNASNYENAIEYFSTALDDSDDWVCRWYLAMSYRMAHRMNHARHEFAYLAEKCPVKPLRQNAQAQLKEIVSAESQATRSELPMWLEVLRSHVA